MGLDKRNIDISFDAKKNSHVNKRANTEKLREREKVVREKQKERQRNALRSHVNDVISQRDLLFNRVTIFIIVTPWSIKISRYHVYAQQ